MRLFSHLRNRERTLPHANYRGMEHFQTSISKVYILSDFWGFLCTFCYIWTQSSCLPHLRIQKTHVKSLKCLSFKFLYGSCICEYSSSHTAINTSTLVFTNWKSPMRSINEECYVDTAVQRCPEQNTKNLRKVALGLIFWFNNIPDAMLLVSIDTENILQKLFCLQILLCQNRAQFDDNLRDKC